MAQNAFIAVNLLFMSILSPAIAQRGGSQTPAPGTMLPKVTAFDEQGQEFSTTSLRGSYTVLVFGCLT